MNKIKKNMKAENNNMILSEKTITKEYQIPELVDLNSLSEAMGSTECGPGSSPTPYVCSAGTGDV